MALWFNNDITPETINSLNPGTMGGHLGITFVAIGEDYLEATMPVDNRTKQPAGLLHGGASVVLAETLGSVGAFLCVNSAQKSVVGLEINANHIRAVRSGVVRGIARPIHVGNSTHIWEIKITNEDEQLVCISRITLAILDNNR